MKITKQFSFCAGHRLSGYEGHCWNLHGHNYLLEVTLESKRLDELGMVMDFGEVKSIVNKVIESFFDHKTILKRDDFINQRLVNGFPPMCNSFYLTDYNPTAENMAKDFYERLEVCFSGPVKLAKIRLYETLTSYADYER